VPSDKSEAARVYCYDYPRPAVAADIVRFAALEQTLKCC